MRFPEFTGEWQKHKLCNIASIVGRIGFRGYTTNDIVAKGKGAIALSPTNIENNRLTYDKDNTYISFYKFEESPEIMIKQGDVVFVKTGSTVGKVAYVDKLMCKTTLNPQLIVLKNIQCDNYLLSVLMSTSRFQNAIRKITVGGAVPTLSQAAMGDIAVTMPQVAEQEKLSKFISLLDKRIATQNKIIKKYESLIKGITQHCIKKSTSGSIYAKLGDICQITTGKLDANAQVDNGIYPFFTCAEQPFKIDNFAFDTEALLISGNGANLGYINYYKGKFNAYQRTYVLDLFSENIQYIKWALKVLLPKRIAIEKSSSNTPYIVLSTLTDLRLPIPCKSEQSFIANLMQSLERKLSNQIALYDSYNYLKQYLLRQMFI